jgi:hypothetical protein
MAYKVGSTTVIDDNGQVDWSRIVNAPASNTLAAIAAASAAVVGTYVFATSTSASDAAFGATRAGSALNPTSAACRFADSGASTQAFTLGAGLSGTWRCMGAYDHLVQISQSMGGGQFATYTMYGATLWLRIA